MSQGLVIYADGGCWPNPGPSGWGIHGYLYDTELTKKIPGNIGHILTPKGYELKLGLDEKLVIDEVIPMHYVDGYGAVAGVGSNNIGELSAAINGLQHAATYNLTNVQIFTDSEYVRKGLEFWVDGWRKNNWLKQDGTEPANINYWKQLVEAKEVLTNRGISVKIDWVKGHVDILGNVLADKLATIATLASRRNKISSDITISSPIGYWKTETGDHHPLISNSRMFFNTMPEYIKPGEYYLGETDRDDDSFGQRTSDGTYSVVKLDVPDDALELVRNYQSKIAYGKDSIILARLDALYKAGIYQDILKFGELSIDQTSLSRLDLFALSKNTNGYEHKEPLTREFIPPKLCMRAVENISRISNILDIHLSGQPGLVVTDITDILYELEVKPAKKAKDEPTSILKLKPEFAVGFAALKTNMNYKFGDDVASISVILTLGVDIPNRNVLKRLETYNPKIVIVTWLDAIDIIRYATIITADGGKSIYCGTYSNRRIIGTAV